MQVGNGSEKVRNVAELPIGVDLFKIGLSKTIRVGFVFRVRTITRNISRRQMHNLLLADQQTLLSFAFTTKRQAVAPHRFGINSLGKFNFNGNLGISPRQETA